MDDLTTINTFNALGIAIWSNSLLEEILDYLLYTLIIINKNYLLFQKLHIVLCFLENVVK